MYHSKEKEKIELERAHEQSLCTIFVSCSGFVLYFMPGKLPGVITKQKEINFEDTIIQILHDNL